MGSKESGSMEVRMKTTKELEDAVRQYQNGDTDSFDQIYKLSYRYLRACVIHVVKDEEIAADMLQETYLEISRNISQLKSAEDFLSWASTIGNRKCYAYLKKQRDVLVRSDNDQDGDAQDFFESIADDEAFIPEAILQDREKQRLVQEIIDGLSDMQRLCIIGFYYRGQSIEEIAQELEIPANTVKSHLSRAKAKIKDAVIVLDREKGTRLYSLAPFMLLFLSMEAEACEAGPMPEALKKELGGSGVKNPGAKNSVIKKLLQSGVRYKLIAGAVLASVVIGGGAALIYYANARNAGEENPAETALADAEAGSDMAAETGAAQEDDESAAEADENLQAGTAEESETEGQETAPDTETEEQETVEDTETEGQETVEDAEPEEQEDHESAAQTEESTAGESEPEGQETAPDAEPEEQEDGDGAKEAHYKADGTLDAIYEYDANGNLVKRYFYYADGTLDCINEYNANGNLVKQSYYYSDDTIDFYYIWEYDANGNPVKQSGYDADGRTVAYYIWEYDGNGNCVKYTDYNADGTIYSYYIYEYDANGNLVKRSDYKADGTLTSYFIFEYDANGNLVKRTDYSADGTNYVNYY